MGPLLLMCNSQDLASVIKRINHIFTHNFIGILDNGDGGVVKIILKLYNIANTSSLSSPLYSHICSSDSS